MTISQINTFHSFEIKPKLSFSITSAPKHITLRQPCRSSKNITTPYRVSPTNHLQIPGLQDADIDSDLSAKTRAQANKLIAKELPPDYATKLHPSLPEIPDTSLSDLMQQEIDRKATGLPMTGGIDLSRYENPELPDTANDTKSGASDKWNATLRQAYIASTHVSTRVENLSLLEQHGKNAWLVSNAQLEEILRGLEKELAEVKEATEAVNKARKLAQEGSKGEMIGLEDAWKQGVRRIIEVELAAEDLRQQILDARRQNSR